ncbi:MAG: hypothetical protein P9M11_10515 [Candidatus Tenebribacter burtonii]|jgi:hypothetical protein|nr:hypothetical protein [Candidatus Tenebribacter burtonii]
MKKALFSLVLIVMITALFAGVQEKLEQFGKDNGIMYVKPLVTAFGATMNTGLFNTANVLKPFTFGLNVNTMLAFVPNEDKTFTAVRPDLFIDDPENPGEVIYLYSDPELESATVFGKDGATFEHNDLLNDIPGLDASQLDLSLPNGANLPAVPFLMPQFNLGLPFGNEIMIRGCPKVEISKDIGDLGFWGVGLKHSVSQYIPLIPIDIAIQAAYQNLYIGDLLTFSNFNANLEVSKKLLMWTLYTGVGYDKTNVTAEYDYIYQIINEDNEIESIEKKIKFDVDGENEMRATAGIRYSLLLFKLYADYTVSKYSVFNAGIGVSF